MSFGPQSAMSRPQPARVGGGGGMGGNMNWLAPLLQMMQQRQQQRPMQGAQRFTGAQPGLFNPGQQPMQMPAMPQQSMFTPVQQAPRVPFAPYAPPAPPAPVMAGGPGLTQDQLVEWARGVPGSPIFNQAYMRDTGGTGGP
jgi:hypothetical protein